MMRVGTDFRKDSNVDLNCLSQILKAEVEFREKLVEAAKIGEMVARYSKHKSQDF